MSEETNATETAAASGGQNELLVMRESIRMELFKEAYLQWNPEIKKYTGNVANSMAVKAVEAFDDLFSA